MRFIGYDSIQTRWFTSLSNSYNNVASMQKNRINPLIHILSLSNSHNNVASIQKNRGDKSHRVIVALLDVWGVRTSLFIDLLFW